MIIRPLTVVPALAIAGLAFATPALADDTQAWGTASVGVAVAKDWKVQSETTVRTSDARGFYELESALMVGRKLNRKVTLWTGYVHNPNYSHGNFTVMEHRARQQINVDNFAALGPVKLSGRVRLETRWRDGVNGTGWRLRPYVKASLPIAGKTNLNVTNETFVNLGRTAFQRTDGLERMRTALTISTPLSKQITIEGGYLNQHGFVRRGADTDDHVAMATLSANF